MARAWRVCMGLLALASGPGHAEGIPPGLPPTATPPVVNASLRSGAGPLVPAPESTNSSAGAVPLAAPAHFEWRASHWQWHIGRPGFTLLGFVKTLCMISNFVFQISPLPDAMSWGKRENTGETEPAPLVGIFFCGFQWCYYGFFAWYQTGVAGFLVLVEANLSGGILGSYYLWSFYRNCKQEKELRALKVYLCFAACLVFAQTFSLLACTIRSALFFAGFMASGCAILCSASILMPIPQCIQNKDSAPISMAVTLSMGGSGSLWLICGYMLDDPHIAVPQCVALCSCALCIWLKITFPDASADPPMKIRGRPLSSREDPIEVTNDRNSESQTASQETPAATEGTPLAATASYTASSGETFSTYGETGGTF